MLYGADNQNQQLSEAGKTSKDTSPRVKAALGFSAEVTKGSKSTQDLSESSDVKFSQSEEKPVKGSWEGYSDSKSAIIQPNNYGYSNKNIQSARYKDRNDISPRINDSVPLIGNEKVFSDIMTNYTNFSMKDSSSAKINQIIKNNNMF
jgi:ABC-type uncharacterized transport system involved in gliding motility auxiliary subunit